jgi:Ca2+-binding EF-hand superfamily protein
MFSFRKMFLSALSALALTFVVSAGANAQDKEQVKELEKRFAAADKDKDGKLTAEEAKAMPRISSNFSRLDKDKLGFVTLEQIKSMMK